MKKNAEILQKVNVLRTKCIDLLQADKLEEAESVAKEIDAEMQKINKKENETKHFVSVDSVTTGGQKMTKAENLKKISHAVNAFLKGGWAGISEEDKSFVKPLNATDSPGMVESVSTRGGVLVKEDPVDFVTAMDSGFYRLKLDTDVYPTSYKSGTMPALPVPTDGLTNFDELPVGGMNKTQLTFIPLPYNCKSFGDIIPCSRELLEDSSVNVMEVISNAYIDKQIFTENAEILNALDTANPSASTVSGWKGILKALNSVAIGGRRSVVITNQTGWDYLDSACDDNNHPILTPVLRDDGRYTFRGRPVIVLPNTMLADSEGLTPFYCGSLYDAIRFCDRKGMEISASEAAGFYQNAVAVRIVTRFCAISKYGANAMVKVMVDTTA